MAVVLALLVPAACVIPARVATADPYPPTCNYLLDNSCQAGPANPAIHYSPISWPSDASFFAYTMFGWDILDPRVQDPSNGGTSPQNYVNVSSQCPDESAPSIRLALDPINQVVVFRWRTEQIANTYGTGPNAGAYSSSDPWNSAQWTVLIDTDGDGFRDFALHLDGSSGSPAKPIDRVAAIWGNTTGTQSVDYPNDPDIYYLAHNPTAFIDSASQKILNFHNTLTASPSWSNGNSETVWDYGTTRSTNISTPGCTEYQIDYQIPISMLNASVCCQAAPGNICESPSVACSSDAQCTNPAYPRCLAGPTIDGDTPISLLFTTANSLQDPLQKDIVVNGDFIGAVDSQGPFGDPITLNGGTIVQPIVKSLSAQGCGPTALAAQIQDTPVCDSASGTCTTSLDEVDFYYYYDRNGDGVANDGQSWTLIGAGTTTDSPLGRFTATWNSQNLYQGKYLIGVEAVDRADLNGSGKGNRTFSYLSDAEVGGLCSGTPAHDPQLTSPPEAACPPATEDWYGYLAPSPGRIVATIQNTACGVGPPSLSKQVLTAQPVSVGSPTQFRIALSNPNADNAQPVLLGNVHDVLPQDAGVTGFTFVSTDSNTCGASTSPTAGSTSLDWTFSPAVSIPAGGSCSIVFTANAPTTASTYSNTAFATTDFGQIQSPPVDIAVGPAFLTIAKSASVASAAPGSTITYTLTYSNASAISATGVVIQDVLPTGLTFVSAGNGGAYDGGTRTITWAVGSLASGEGPFTVTFDASVDSPYPDAAAIPLVNTASIDSNETAPASASSSTFVTAPRPNLVLQKYPNKTVVDPNAVAPGNQVTFTVSYANIGNASATGVVITDAVPLGFTFVSATGCSHSSGVLTCNVGTVAAGGTGTVTYTLQAASPFTGDDPTVNTATIDSNETNPVSASTQVGIRPAADATCPAGSNSNVLYFHDELVAIPGQGNQYLANLTAPLVSDTGATKLVTAPGGGAYVPALTLYQNPAATRTINVAGNLTTTLYIDRNNGPGITIRGTVQTWRDGVGVVSTLGTGTQSYNGGKTGQFLFTIAGTSGTLLAGDRLRWFFEVSSNTGTDATLLFQWDGTACNALSAAPCASTTFADSHSVVCFSDEASLTANKRVDKLSAQAGSSLAYTFGFANPGGGTLTGAIITDTFPAGVNVSGCTYSLNGGAAVGCSCVGQTCTFPISSSGQPAGQIPGGASGTLVVNVAVASPLAAGISSLTNIAYTDSNQTNPAATNPVTTAIVRPDVTIAKSVSDVLLVPGDTVTYTLTAMNSGTAAASGVQIVDLLPVTAYYTYVAGSVSPGGPTCSYAAGTITCSLGALAVGATTSVTFQMQVAASGAPSGVTVLGNSATVSDAATTGTRTSNNVDVAISTNPNLHLAKSVSDLDGGSVEAGDTLRYTITATNDGSGGASGVVIYDPIPAYTSFVSVSCSTGSGSYDPSANQAVCTVGTLAGPSGSVTMTVDVAVDDVLPDGTTAVDNTATVSASNAASKQASAATSASAAPDLSVVKYGPTSVAYPLTTLAAAASATTSISVASAAYISVGDVIVVGGTAGRVTGVSGNDVTLDTAVTAASGASVAPTWQYTLVYRNSGSATATAVVISDPLPAGVSCVSTSPAADAPGCAATVSWTVGTVAPGENGTLRVRVQPTAAGTFVNTATIESAETTPAPSNSVTTGAGSILLAKSTSTPLVQNGASGTQAGYTITLTNQTAGASAGVTVTDPLPAGFTFVAGSSVFGGGTCSGLPAGGSETATWTGCTVPAGGALSISFTVDIASTVGPATYDNPVIADGGTVSIVPFDETATTSEDVRVVFSGIAGVVFDDLDGDGIQDAGEGGIAGVTVTITGPSCPAGCTVSTEADGSYEFADLTPGTYYVSETDPAGYTSTTSNLVPVAVVAGDTVVNFGDQAQYTVSGVAFEDANGNGVQDAGESGLAGVTIDLYSAGGALVATTTTDADGRYLFDAGDGVVTGSYLVQETDPAGYTSTTGNTVPVSVATGGAATANFGDLQPNTIAGNVFEDLNGDGIRQSYEHGIAGVTVTVQGTTAGASCNPVPCTIATDADGNYQFAGLAPGAYGVTETDPAGYDSTTSNDLLLTLATGEVASGDFGDRVEGVVAGVVYDDVNGDGTRDESEPALVGVLVELYAAGPDGLLGTADDVLVVSMLTDEYGYGFNNIPPGSYLLVETDPSGWTSTTPNAVAVTVPAGGSAGANFGDLVAGAISGVVFDDLNGNGVQDPGEAGIGGVTVTLAGTSGGADCAAGCTTVTSGDGTYIFTDLAPGTYQIVETDPNGWTSTTPNSGTVALAAGGSATLAFGDQLAGTISGVVFDDLDGDGVQDAGEPGLGGVTVELVDPSTGAVVATATTTADGRYLFAGVTAGAYLVRETDPLGFASTTTNLVPVSVAGGGAATANFGDTQPNTIAGAVFDDINGNGVQDPGEPGLGGVAVTLTGTSAGASCPAGCTTTTGTDGSYAFTNLLPGSYTVEETDPSGFASTTSNTVPVTLSSGGAANADFGDQIVGSVSGVVFNDLNGNGVQDAGEPGLGAVTVELVDPSTGAVVATTGTDGSGTYVFTGVAAGPYVVRETDPSGFASTTLNDVPVSVPAAGAATANFGDIGAGTIAGTVFDDLNGNGVQDAGEAGIGGVIVDLYDVSTGALVATVTSSGDGSYLFAGIDPGTYAVHEIDPTGFNSTTANQVIVSLSSGGTATADFGDQMNGTVSGTVFADLNGDGVQDPGEQGLSGVTVTLTGPSCPSGCAATSDADGNYVFSGVTPGSYTVTETDPDGFASSTPNTVNLAVAAGEPATASFGDMPANSISGVVFDDFNGDGLQDENEPGLGGVSVTVVGPSCPAPGCTLETSGDGSYYLGGLAAGAYTVAETNPTGFGSTTPDSVALTLAGGDAAAANFGDRTGSTISGVVFDDLNGDGHQDADEPGIGGVVVTLTGIGGGAGCTTGCTAVTTSDGRYVFVGLVAGDYLVTETNPDGYVSTTADTAPVTLTAGDSESVNFGDQIVGSVSGVVFEDLDSNGVQDPGEPGLAGVTVTLTGPSCPTGCTVVTPADGSYSFTGLIPGSYSIVESDPTGYVSTTQNNVALQVAGTPLSVAFGDIVDSGGAGGVDLTVAKSHSGVLQTCENAVYTMQVHNVGTDPTNGMFYVTDVLPAGLTYVSASGSGWSCTAAGQVVTCTHPGVLDSGASSSVITLTVRVGQAAYPTINNTATVTGYDDDNPINDSKTDAATVRQGSKCGSGGGPEACSVSLRKVHAGNDNPGGVVTYTLQWANSCKGAVANAVISDPLPEGLLLLSASSSDATVTVADNTATFLIPSFAGGAVGQGFITARIDPLAAVGKAIRNKATYADGDGRATHAANLFRVRGGGTSSQRISCAIRGQSYASPGRYVRYSVRYKNGSANNTLTLDLADDVDVVDVWPQATTWSGNTIEWQQLARTSGKTLVNTTVSPLVEDGTMLVSSASIDDGLGNVGVCEQITMVNRSDKLFASLKAQSKLRAGASIRYVARYREAVGHNRMTVSLPDEVTVVRAIPEPSASVGNTLIWDDLALPAGVVKIDGKVAPLADGTVLVGSLTMADESGSVATGECQTAIKSSESTVDTGGGGGAIKVSAFALRTVTVGNTTDVSLDYSGMQPPGSVVVDLPDEMTPVLAVPSASFSGHSVTWAVTKGSAGSAKVRVAVAPDAPSGKVLTIRVSATDSTGATASGSASTTVR